MTGIEEIQDPFQPVIDLFPVGVLPHVFLDAGQEIVDDHSGLRHLFQTQPVMGPGPMPDSLNPQQGASGGPWLMR
jgi:hypothetical protein